MDGAAKPRTRAIRRLNEKEIAAFFAAVDAVRNRIPVMTFPAISLPTISEEDREFYRENESRLFK